jgi:phosphoglycerate kinase
LKTTSDVLGKAVEFVSDCIGEEAKCCCKITSWRSLLLLENLRFHKEEEAGDVAFAKELASLGDIYVNDAFNLLIEHTFNYNHCSIFN